jgi:chaperone modulatory protein CbpM
VIKDNINILKRLIITETTDDETVSLIKLCHCTEIPVEQIFSMVEYGVLEPINSQLSHIRWRFSANSILRVKTALRLQRDLDVNMAGAALAIELMDELKQLRQNLNNY